MLKFIKIKNFLIKYIFLFLIILIILHQQNFFKNIYEIATKNYHTRMLISHGNCDRRGYGFLKHVKEFLRNIKDSSRNMKESFRISL